MVGQLEKNMSLQKEVISRKYLYWNPVTWQHLYDFTEQRTCKAICDALRNDARGKESVFKIVVDTCKSGYEHLLHKQATKEYGFDGLQSLCDRTTIGQEAIARTVVSGTCVDYLNSCNGIYLHENADIIKHKKNIIVNTIGLYDWVQ